MRRRRRREKISRKQRRIKNRVTFRTIFLLAITLIFNTYSWFLYANTVSADLTAQVDAWKVQFSVDSQLVDRQFIFNIDHAYPGMETQVKDLLISNTGDKVADLTYSIIYMRIFDDVYISNTAIAEGMTAPQGSTTLTEAQLMSKAQNDFPFLLSFTASSQTIAVNSSAHLVVSFSWAYETGNDATDTQYGMDAYDFNSSNPTTPSIEVIIKVVAAQQQQQQQQGGNP